jgi:citrate lyase beta subunit
MTLLLALVRAFLRNTCKFELHFILLLAQCRAIGATRTEAASELLYARQSVVAHAKAFNLQAIDIVQINYKDVEALKKESEQGAIMGFSGKQIR